MDPGQLWRRTAIAVTVGVVAVVVSRLVSVGGGEYVAGPIAGVLVHTLPTPLLTWTIAMFGGYAETLFAFSAAGLAAALFALVSFLLMSVVGRIGTNTARLEPIATALGTALFAAVLTGSITHAIGLGIIGGTIVWLGGHFERSSVSAGEWSRRETVTALGGGVLAGFGTLLASRGTDTTQPELSLSEQTQREIEELRNAAAARELDVPGLPGLLTPNEEFYIVDINIDPPIVDAEEWSVTIDGAVETEIELTRDRLDLFDPVSELRTLRCIAEELNGIRIGTAVWTGVPMADILDQVGPNGAYAKLTAADRYSAVFPLEMLKGARLVYAMNGRALPRKHGFPVRMIVPGSWGKINVKWLTGIEIITEEEDGFWSEWNGDSSVNTISKLWQAQPTEEGMVLAGHAYAGDRGISTVEVSTDGGDTWAEATLSEPLPDSATWRQWRYEWRPERDTVEVVVRAIDGEGRLQTEEYSEPKPDGPTGWVSRRVDTTEAKDFTRGYRR